MDVFIILFAILVILYFVTSNNQRSSQSRLYQTIFCTFLLICIQGLRHESIGIDSYNAYRPFFEYVMGGFNSLFNMFDIMYGFEPGFVLFTKFVKTLFDDTQTYIFICSVVSILPIAFLIYKYADNIPFAFIIFSCFILYHFGFSGIRQAIAIGVTVIAFECIVKKKLVMFIGLVLLASTIHKSALLFIIAYPLYHKLQLTPKVMFFVAIGFIVGLFFLKPIVLGLTEYIFGGEKYMHKAIEDTVPSYNLMILLACMLFFTYMTDDERILPLRSMLLMTVVFQSLGLLSNSASRMAYYFMPYLAIALPMTTSSMQLKKKLELFIIAFCIFFFFYSNGGGYLGVIPYKFCWE